MINREEIIPIAEALKWKKKALENRTLAKNELITYIKKRGNPKEPETKTRTATVLAFLGVESVTKTRKTAGGNAYLEALNNNQPLSSVSGYFFTTNRFSELGKICLKCEEADEDYRAATEAVSKRYR